jgi:hypothetical protein
MQNLKAVFKFLRPAISLGAVVFIGCVYLHDDGVPASLSDTEVQHVLKVGGQLESHVDKIIVRFGDFIAYPDREQEMVFLLLDALNEYQPILQEVATNPVFFLSCEQTLAMEQRVEGKHEELKEICANAPYVILNRVKTLNHDQDTYDMLADALREMSEIEGGPCDPTKCCWCRCKNFARR